MSRQGLEFQIKENNLKIGSVSPFCSSKDEKTEEKEALIPRELGNLGNSVTEGSSIRFSDECPYCHKPVRPEDRQVEIVQGGKQFKVHFGCHVTGPKNEWASGRPRSKQRLKVKS